MARNSKAAQAWAASFKLMRTIDVPESFTADRPMNVPPEERGLFEDDD